MKYIFSEGPTFVPRNKCVGEFNTQFDVEQFYHHLSLQHHFCDKDDNKESTELDAFAQLAEEKISNWTPPLGKSNTLDLYTDKCRHEIDNLDLKKTSQGQTSNITSGEPQAVKSLWCNQDIIIKRADKGGAVAVWKKDLYIAQRQNFLMGIKATHWDQHNHIHIQLWHPKCWQDNGRSSSSHKKW